MADDIAMHPTALAVKRSVTVKCSQEHAFATFTAIDKWWARDHHIGTAPLEEMVIEPKEGGRCYGRDADGEWDWGKVLVWEPCERVVIAWQLTAEWRYDPNFVTEVEVTFRPEGTERTLVELEHRNIERYADAKEEIFASLDSEGGWNGSLKRFAEVAEAS